MTRQEIQAESEAVERTLKEYLSKGERLIVVKAPPGSGKTYLLLRGVEHLADGEQRVAIGTQTNSQADDICRRLATDYPDIPVIRFATARSAPKALGASIRWVTDKGDLPSGGCVVVSTVAKWSLTELPDTWDILFVDEAWQMSWSDFMLCGQLTDRFVLIGDPGQIPPVVPIAVNRWETSPRAPHQPAPELVLADTALPTKALELPACRRLPWDSVELVRPFYDFEFGAWALAGERLVRPLPPQDGTRPVDPALDLLATGSVSALTLPTPVNGPPLELDGEIARLAAETAVRIIERGAEVVDDDSARARPLQPSDIGLAATHRVVNSAMHSALPRDLRGPGRVVVDTPERWQGLERKMMIVVHPLSGVTHPSSFDLETGRLCVMTSRHRSGLVVVGRDHIRGTLESHIPAAEQAVGRPDITGRGHQANLRFWETMADSGRVVAAA
jgi:hypothetical protein